MILAFAHTMDNNVEGARQNGSNKSSNITASTVTATKVNSSNIGVITNIGSSGTNSSFWKNSGRLVPGRPSPKRGDDTSLISSSVDGDLVRTSGGKGDGMVSTFRDYQQSVSDAWDTGDDEFCIMSGAAASAASANDSRISKKVSQTAALNVIETHRNSATTSTVRSSAATSSAANAKSTRVPTVTIKSEQQLQRHRLQHSISQTSEEGAPSNDSKNDTEARMKVVRNFHAYPGRPQLQKFSSNAQETEYETKIEKFQLLLDSPLLDLVALKKLSWSGVPKKMRAVSWRLLSKYLPPAGERRNAVLESKRQGYQDLRHNYFRVDSQDESQQDTYRQIHIDVPRMNPQISLFQQKLVQEMFERILFIWAIRHPASGYVQGINDLVTPFFIVFLQEVLEPGTDLEKFNIDNLSVDKRDAIEADSFWCLSKFLDCIQDNYIFAQLGIQEKVNQLKDLIQRIDGNLHRHLQAHGVDYLQFSFRWMNNLLTRELPLHCTIRLWDTYLAESDGFALFHLYVCAAFLLHWKDRLMQQNDFQGLLLLLQNLPTENWSDRQINVLVAEAFRLKFTYADAPKHLEVKS
ncbi:TBC1 domain family member 22B-like isoform X1 [Rhagoletis pomonella]|uniref:TBC1 domain family member 22B-like isoform X1 n=2 Tax=Rhagoletis pomonella TaxID=28610 RepID=UPI00177D3973|nr:TBC1 domain family member 22B-like isoform X1 [Rhagoletis pomonella]